MKKYFYLLMLSLVGFAFTACEDVPEPYRINTDKTQTDVLLSESFSSSLGKFQSKAASGDLEWIIDYSSAVITGYKDFDGDGKKENKAGVTYLVGPAIDLADVTAAYVSISQAINYEKSTIKDDHKLLASEDYTNDVNAATWTELPLLFDGVGGSFTFVDQQVQIPESLMGKKINLALKHTAHDSYSSTWEVKNFKVQKGQASSGGGDTPTPQPTEGEGSGTAADPYNVAAALSLIQSLGADVNSAEVYIKGKISEIKSIDTGNYGNAEYYISDDGTTTNQLLVYRGYGLNGDKFKSANDIKVGDEVVIVGKVVNFKGNTPEVTTGSKIYKLNGEGGGGDTPDPTPGEAKGTGTLEDPYNSVAANNVASALGSGEKTAEAYYIKGKVVSVKEAFSAQYGNSSFYISDDGTNAGQFYVFRALYFGNQKWVSGNTQIKAGDEVIVYAKLTNYQGNTPETAQGDCYLYSLNGKTEDDGSGSGEGGDPDPDPTPGGEGTSLADFTNGDFETWADGIPTGWQSTTTASTAGALSQSTDAHGGSYSVKLAGTSASNKRLAYKELTLEAGDYTVSFFAKGSADGCSIRPGYVPVTDGAVDSYVYGNYTNDIPASSWTQVTYTFSLSVETTVNLVLMNPKNPGLDILIDDYTIVKN